MNGRLPFPFCRFTVRTPLNGGTANDFGNVFLTSTVHVSCCSDDDSVTSLTEFNIQKHTPRYPVSGDVMSHDNHVIKSQEPAPRIMALSENCIIERDPATYIVVTVRPLSEV